ncbi:FxLD family lanthipeptide [Streptomyces sp. NPDC047072]|uniref:FxLD family lanthipeptide n=1 Tax=Streptomyces sp. NPDC047072 TaxID=3154809 RepID=UPI0033F9A261
MSTQTIQRTAGTPEPAAADAETDDPFHLDITFIENTPDTETVLMCSTGDTCGSSCPSACSGSTV